MPNRLDPSAAPRAWTGFVVSNACCTAVPSRTRIRFHALYDKVAVQPVTASIQRVGVPPWEGFDCPGSDVRRAWGVTPGRGSPEVKAPDGPVACGGRVGWLRGASNPRGRSVKRTLQRRYVMPPRAPVWECSMPAVEFESAEPLTTWRRPVPVGKDRMCVPAGLSGAGAAAPREGSMTQSGEGLLPSQDPTVWQRPGV